MTKIIIALAFFFYPTIKVSAQIPVITSISSLSGNAGSTLTINGDHFNPIAANNTVRFGTVKATVLTASVTSLSVAIPAQASYAPVSVTNNNLTGKSAQFFSIAFAGEGTSFHPNSFSERTDSLLGTQAGDEAATDVDNDGRTDIAIIGSNNQVYLYRNTGSIGNNSFAAKIIITTGKNPSAICFADIDGDGNEDMLVVNNSDSSVSVYKNTSTKGVISFDAPVNFLTGGPGDYITTSDFNNDGKPDIAVANSASNTIGLLTNNTNNGVIDFGIRQLLTTGIDPTRIAAADLDGDGRTDIIVGNTTGNSISVFINTSLLTNTSFAAKTDFPFFGPLSVCAMDLDGDSKPELFFSHFQNATVTVLPNTSTPGNLSFGTQKNFSIILSQKISAADMNGDGEPDIIAANSLPYGISVLANNSTPGSIDFKKFISYPLPSTAGDLLINDMDGDSRPDISVSYNGGMEIVRNTLPYPGIISFTPTMGGSGSIIYVTGYNFSPSSLITIGGLSPASYSVDSLTGITAIADTGSSGKIKVTNEYGSAELAGFTFGKAPHIVSFSPVAVSQTSNVYIKGINFTGATAVTFAGNAASSFSVLSPTLIKATVGNTGTGTFYVSVTNPFGIDSINGLYTGPTIKSFVPTSGPAGTKVIITGTHFGNTMAENTVYFGAVQATVNYADSGRLEVIVPTGTTYEPVSVTVNNLSAYSANPFVLTFAALDYSFTATSFTDVADSNAGNFPVRQVAADFNNDGKNDIAVADFGVGFHVSVLQNSSQNGAVSFKSRVDYPISTNPARLVAGDLDGDGKKDLIVAAVSGSDYTDSLSIFRNSCVTGGDISFDQKLSFSTGYETDPRAMALADFDGDGKPDIAVADYNQLIVLQNTSTVTQLSFAKYQYFYYYVGAQGIAVADVDRDGKPDLIVCGINGLAVLKNTSVNGIISFITLANVLTNNSSMASVAAGDLDNDGLPDLAVSNAGNSQMQVYKNTSIAGLISFEGKVSTYQDKNNGNITIGDINGDGKPDIAVLSNDDISVFENNCSNNSFSFANPVVYYAPYGYGADDLSLADLNGDGKPDAALSSTGNKVSIYINNMPANTSAPLPLIINGTAEICAGDSIVLQTTAVDGAVYQWYKDDALTITSNSATFVVNSGGTYSVSMTIASVTTMSSPVIIAVKTIPPTPVIAAIGSTLCQDHNIVLSSSAPNNNQWYINNTIIAGSTDTVYRAVSGGSYTVVTNSNGCFSLPAVAKLINSYNRPVATISPSGIIWFCDGDSSMLHATALSNLSYQWAIGNNPLPGATTPNLTVYAAGIYTLRVDSIGCTGISDADTVITMPIPSKPVISKTSISLLLSSAATGNQWYYNGVLITGATATTYQPADAGNYTVNATVSGCTSAMSDIFNYTITSIVTIDNTHFIMINPNPAKTYLRLTFNLQSIGTLRLKLLDATGRDISTWTNLVNGSLINIANLPTGMYYAIVDGNGVNKKMHYTLKVLKL